MTRGRNGRRGGKRHRLHLRAQTLRSRSIARIRSIPGAVGSAAIVGRRCAIELGTRAFELLLALLEANGSLVSKEQLLTRVWPGIAVAEHNVKVHVCALRKALGEHHDYVRTEFGRGYRFIAAVRSTVPGAHITDQCGSGIGQLRGCFVDGSLGDRPMVGRLTLALAETLISLDVQALHSAESRLPERASMPIRRMEFDDEGHGLLQEWRPRSFPVD